MLTEQERQIILKGKNEGLSKEQAYAQLGSFRRTSQSKPSEDGLFKRAAKETGGDVLGLFKNSFNRLKEGGQRIVDASSNPEGSFGGNVNAGVSEIFRGVGRFIGGAAVDTGKILLPSQKAEDAIEGTVEKVGKKVGETELAQRLMQEYQSLDPQTKQSVDSILGYLEGLAEIGTAGVASRVSKPVIESATQATKRGAKAAFEKGSSLLGKRAWKSADEVVEAADEALGGRVLDIPEGATASEIRRIMEDQAPKLGLKERWVGVSPDIKKRIQGKPDQLQEYFDIAHARNLDDTVDTPQAFAARRADEAVNKMEGLLNDTGGEIGATRRKIGTVQASSEQIGNVERIFREELDKLNLEVRNGVVGQKRGTVARTGGKGDIAAINDLYQQFRTVKQNPSLTNMIDLRSLFDSKIRFDKSAREISNSVDPLSRRMRSELANTSAGIVGKSEAEKLTQYSQFIDAYNDLKGFTDRAAGGEYLLRLVLSGRGREAKEIIDTINKYTGIDLMDDATMMTLATDLIGNTRQKNLFRQEVTKAGLDLTSLMTGNPASALPVLGHIGEWLVDKALDPEKILMDAARSSP